MSFVFDTSRWVPYVESPRPPPVEIDLRDGDAMATPRLVDAVWTDAIVGGVEAALYLRDEWGGKKLKNLLM